MQKAFDIAWTAVASSVDPAYRNRRRETLATIVLSLATARSEQDPQEMSQMAVRLLELIDEVA